MNKNNLLIARGLFTLIVIVTFGLIIMNEKGAELFSSQIENKINQYLDSNYSSLDFVKSNIRIDKTLFSMKISSKENKHLYFTVSYQNKNIKDTYEKDYKEGTTLFNYLKEKQQTEIKEKTKEIVKVEPVTTLDQYSESVQKQIIKEDNLLSLRYYYIEKEIKTEWKEESITQEITDFINTMINNIITPKYYNIVITDKEDITKSIKINHLTEDFINNNNKNDIIRDIMNNDNSNLLKENKITYKVLN